MHLNAYTLNDTQVNLGTNPGGNGPWVPARPEPGPWIERLRNARAVLRGTADSIVFPGQGKQK